MHGLGGIRSQIASEVIIATAFVQVRQTLEPEARRTHDPAIMDARNVRVCQPLLCGCVQGTCRRRRGRRCCRGFDSRSIWAAVRVVGCSGPRIRSRSAARIPAVITGIVGIAGLITTWAVARHQAKADLVKLEQEHKHAALSKSEALVSGMQLLSWQLSLIASDEIGKCHGLYHRRYSMHGWAY